MNNGLYLPSISSSLINLLIAFIFVQTINTEWINKTREDNFQFNKNYSLKILNCSQSKENLTDQVEIHDNITQEYNQTYSSLVENKSGNESVEALNSTALNTTAVNTNETELSSDETKKSINRRSVTKIFGYFSENGDFNYCTEPQLNASKAIEKAKKGNSTFWLCQHFNKEELDAKFSRKIQSNNGFKGVFGYYHFGKFLTCLNPERLIEDTTREDIKYIPFDLNYNSMCHYFDNDPGNKFDAVPKSEKFVSASSDHLGVKLSIQFILFVLAFHVKSILT